MTDVRLSLISHTNVGKTTLMRTLLRRDVGEVFDLVHVTRESQGHVALELADDRLVLNDTPGFGNSARLLERLRKEPNPLAWLLDKLRQRLDEKERTLALNAEAVRAVKELSDAVLYLVDASQDPDDAGYVRHELELLTWLDRPALILLNYTSDSVGTPADGAATGDLDHERAAELAQLRTRWEEFAGEWDIVRGVIPLDAFGRCWVEESALFDRVVGLVEGEQREAMARLADGWTARNLEVFERSCAAMSEVLVAAARDEARYSLDGALSWVKERVVGRLGLAQSPEDAKAREAFETMGARLEQQLQRCIAEVIREHELDGRSRQTLADALAAVQVDGDLVRRKGFGTLVGAVVSGAATGLGADVLAGGLTLGGGAVLGAIAGALGGAGLERVVSIVRKDDGERGTATATWSAGFLDDLLVRICLTYLAIAHHGRGRGEFRDGEIPPRWKRVVGEVADEQRADWHRAWSAARKGDEAGERLVGAACRRAIAAVLVRGYPASAPLFTSR